MNTVAASVEINRLLWFNLTRVVHRRGENERESGAFLLARPNDTRVVRFICYDDLDPRSLDTGIVHFNSAGYVKLWKICQEEKLRVVADIHTHPTKGTGQSELDAMNPMIPQKGQMALIVPRFARGSRFGLRGVGIYEYLGESSWRQWPASSGKVRLTLI
jgi:proteasome lid subunit RPN8/RPN11